MHIKHFKKWLSLKSNLDALRFKPPFVSNGDIWWASIGENVGSEISGKSKLFSRPVIVIKKLSHGFYFVVPTTTSKRDGSWYVKIRQQEKEMRACLHQARSIDFRRLSNKLGRLDDEDIKRVKNAFLNLYK